MWGVGWQVSGFQAITSKVNIEGKEGGGGPPGLLCAPLQGGPQETGRQWHRCPQRIGSKHRWTLDREWRGEDGRAQGVSAQVVSGDTGKKGAMSRFE